MSMINAQCDELREYASRADGTFPMLASALRDAADTIWQLRDDLQRANDAVRDAEHDESMAWDRVRKAEAENAKLRSELESVGTASYLYGRSDLQAENAKLREMACTLVYCMQVHNDCDGCRLNGSKGELSYDPLLACDGLHERMRELGVEVDA